PISRGVPCACLKKYVIFIYYASSDTRMHVATSTIDRLVDYCFNTPEEGYSTSASVETLKKLIIKNSTNNK
ncbi:MAG: hypothetical protein ACOCOY_02000, partial [Prevotella sp.]